MNSRPFVETHTAGDTLDMSIANENAITVEDYPASDGWTLKYRLTPQFTSPAQAPIDIDCATDSDGESYKLQVSAGATANWKPGSYFWSRRVERGGDRVTLERDQQLDILPDPAQTSAGDDRRTHARKLLEQVQAALLALNSGIKSYTIGTRQVTYRDMPELISEESRLKWLVANEEARAKIAASGINPRKIGIRFSR